MMQGSRSQLQTLRRIRFERLCEAVRTEHEVDAAAASMAELFRVTGAREWVRIARHLGARD